eukprot:5507071-Amphidinium_carterae.1
MSLSSFCVAAQPALGSAKAQYLPPRILDLTWKGLFVFSGEAQCFILLFDCRQHALFYRSACVPMAHNSSKLHRLASTRKCWQFKTRNQAFKGRLLPPATCSEFPKSNQVSWIQDI